MNSQAGVSSDVRGYQQGDDRLVYPFAAPGLELSSPALFSGLGKPRLFVRAAPQFIFDLDRAVAKEGDPGEVTIFFIDPDGPDGPAPPRFPSDDNITGAGSETRVKSENLGVLAGAGVAFAFPVGERELRIKPSIEYRYDAFEVSTALSDARSSVGNGACPCRIAEIAAQDTKGFHAVGPGLEAELDAQRLGDFMLTVFLSAQGYYVLGDRTIDVGASGFYDTGEPVSVVSTFKRSPWTFQGGVGLRIQWRPE